LHNANIGIALRKSQSYFRMTRIAGVDRPCSDSAFVRGAHDGERSTEGESR